MRVHLIVNPTTAQAILSANRPASSNNPTAITLLVATVNQALIVHHPHAKAMLAYLIALGLLLLTMVAIVKPVLTAPQDIVPPPILANLPVSLPSLLELLTTNNAIVNQTQTVNLATVPHQMNASLLAMLQAIRLQIMQTVVIVSQLQNARQVHAQIMLAIRTAMVLPHTILVAFAL